jgi:predicted phosphohydrolase
MRRLIHLSDLHFGTELPALVEGLLQSCADFAPHLAVVSGDLTQRARPEQFESARRFLCQLPCPALVVPGNHDIAPLYRPLERVLTPLARYHRYLRDVSCERWQDEELAVVGLSSVRPLRVKEGSVTPRQLRGLCEGLQPASQALRMIAVHHPVLAGPSARAVALRVALAACDVAVCLSGHLHVSSHRPFASAGDALSEGGERELGLPRTELPTRGLPGMLLLQAATATSQRLRGEANGYHRLTVDGPTLQVEVMAWTEHRRFERVAAVGYQRREGVWREQLHADQWSAEQVS